MLSKSLAQEHAIGGELDVTWKQVWETREIQAVEAVPVAEQTPETPL